MKGEIFMSKKKLEQALTATFALNYDLRYFVEDGVTWAVAVDVARILEIENIRQNLADFPDDEKKKFDILTAVCNTYGEVVRNVKESVWCVNEPGLYRLIFMSRKPEAEKFKRWIFHEVLPSIRKNGFYALPQEENVTIQIKGAKNLSAFKEKYPNIKFSEKAYLIGTYFEDGVENEETFIRYDLTVNLNDYKKIEQKYYSQLFISN